MLTPLADFLLTCKMQLDLNRVNRVLFAAQYNLKFESARHSLGLIDCFEIWHEHIDKCDCIYDTYVSHND